MVNALNFPVKEKVYTFSITTWKNEDTFFKTE